MESQALKFELLYLYKAQHTLRYKFQESSFHIEQINFTLDKIIPLEKELGVEDVAGTLRDLTLEKNQVETLMKERKAALDSIDEKITKIEDTLCDL